MGALVESVVEALQEERQVAGLTVEVIQAVAEVLARERGVLQAAG